MGKTILLVDDHKILRDGLRSLLETQMRDHQIVGEAENGQEAIDLAIKLKPDVVIMDISLDEINGIDATKQILLAQPDIKIIALSMHSDKRFVVDMLRAGGAGYLLKDCAFEELEDAITAVTSNKKYISPGLSDIVLDDYVEKLQGQSSSSANILSERELEVLVRLAKGQSAKEIAQELNLSTKTVDTYRLHISDKLGIHTIADLVKYAIREGLTTLDREKTS